MIDFEIETNRLILRKFKQDDIDGLMEYHNDVDWMKYQEFKGLSKEEYISIIFGDFKIENGIQLALELKKTKQLVGDIYLRENGKLLYLGYSLNRKYCHLGFMTEVLETLVERTLNNGYTLKAEVLEENIDSIRLLERLGFIFENKNVYNELVYFKKRIIN